MQICSRRALSPCFLNFSEIWKMFLFFFELSKMVFELINAYNCNQSFFLRFGTIRKLTNPRRIYGWFGTFSMEGDKVNRWNWRKCQHKGT